MNSIERGGGETTMLTTHHSPLTSKRPALTLVEVLVSIFIMGIGLLSLLVLFPLGSLYWAQANKDDLTGHAAANANALALTFDLRHDPGVARMYDTPPAGLPRPVTGGVGYPVYVDALGIDVGGFNGVPIASLAQGIPRVAPDYVQNNGVQSPKWSAEQYFSMLDSMTYDDNGRPVVEPPAVGQVDRPSQSTFNWAYLLRPTQRDFNGKYATVYLTVVVYNKRSMTVLGEDYYGNITFVPGSQSVQLPFTGAMPNIKKGSWLLDATLSDTDAQGNPAPHGFFYRVSNVVEDPAGGVLDITLETPLRQPNPAAPSSGTANGILVLMDGVVEVFERGP